MTKKIVYIIIAVGIFLIFLIWLFVESSKPLPGTKITDLGRGHVPIGESVDYNSNPPTSGKHYADWIRSGVYSEVKDDRNLVHSLEHGYVIMHYGCNLANQSEEATKSAEASPAGQLDSQQLCDQRKDQLAKIYQKKGQSKLIVVPRLNLDANFALTAWTYLDRFDKFDSSRIEKFIDAHLNMGPEKSME